MSELAPNILAIATLVTAIGGAAIGLLAASRVAQVGKKTEESAQLSVENGRKADAIIDKAETIRSQTDGHLTALRAETAANREEIRGLRDLVALLKQDKAVAVAVVNGTKPAAPPEESCP